MEYTPSSDRPIVTGEKVSVVCRDDERRLCGEIRISPKILPQICSGLHEKIQNRENKPTAPISNPFTLDEINNLPIYVSSGPTILEGSIGIVVDRDFGGVPNIEAPYGDTLSETAVHFPQLSHSIIQRKIIIDGSTESLHYILLPHTTEKYQLISHEDVSVSMVPDEILKQELQSSVREEFLSVII